MVYLAIDAHAESGNMKSSVTISPRLVVRINSFLMSCAPQCTQNLLLSLNSNEMWIGNLQIATACRMRGLGRSLVQVAAKIAAAFEMREINVFPLQGTLDFWRKMDTVQNHARHVFCKDVFVGRDVVVRVNESQDLCRETRDDSLHAMSHV